MDAAELKARTKEFALRCMKLADALPRTRSAEVIARQLIKCGTSVGANYRAACRAKSRADFAFKLGIVEEEIDESAYWMELIVESAMQPTRLVEPLRREAVELTRIAVASIRTTRSRIANPKSAVRNPQ